MKKSWIGLERAAIIRNQNGVGQVAGNALWSPNGRYSTIKADGIYDGQSYRLRAGGFFYMPDSADLSDSGFRLSIQKENGDDPVDVASMGALWLPTTSDSGFIESEFRPGWNVDAIVAVKYDDVRHDTLLTAQDQKFATGIGTFTIGRHQMAFAPLDATTFGTFTDDVKNYSIAVNFTGNVSDWFQQAYIHIERLN